MAKTKIDQDGFINRVLQATPPWALATLSLFVGFTICFVFILTVGDLKGPFARIVEAQVVRIEKAADSLESITKRLDETERKQAETATQTTEIFHRVQQLDIRVERLEAKR
jgi:hypothetical protein